MGTHQIVPTILVGLIAFIIGAYAGKRPDDETIRIFWE
jgi:Na+/pantothenate symporter